MREEEGAFEGAGGLRIWWRSWRPDRAPDALVVIAHGGGEHSGRYVHVAQRLTDAGFAVHALDHRGHGRSGGTRGLVDRFDHVVADLGAFVERAREAEPGVPAFLLGHSMGGAISLRYAIDHQDRLDGLLLSGPVALIETAGPLTRAAARILSPVVPKLGVYEVDVEGISRDPAVVDAYVNDPLVFHGKLPVRTVAELTSAVGRFPDAVGGLRLPLLVFHGAADEIASPNGARMVAERAGSDDVTLRLYDGLCHEVLNEPEKDAVMDDVIAWLREHM
jgi:alpha-beta hydrolase superfamily lysophospholipase